jgi:hypothetical protein
MASRSGLGMAISIHPQALTHRSKKLHSPLTALQFKNFFSLNRTNSPPNIPPPSPNLLPLAFFTMICAQWILMCEYINARLGQIEWEIELGLSNLYAQDFDHTSKHY